MIRFLKNAEIDREAWDYCISNSRQNLIYGLSWYLDIVSPGWCGLVDNGYSTVMPLPVKIKYGFPYIIQPIYTQQLGIFSGKNLPAEEIKDFMDAIPQQYKYIALNLNFNNDGSAKGLSVRENNNFELSLEKNYESIASAFSANTRRNLQKAKDLKIWFDGSLEELLQMKTENTGINRKRIPTQKIQEFTRAVMERGAGFICSASAEGKTCAMVFFLHHKERIYYLIPVSNSTGKEKKAMFAIADRIIHKFAGNAKILDFEGSNIPGIARFFEGFGAVNRPYPALKINRLPFPLNQFRKF